jgi:hypothetical protein
MENRSQIINPHFAAAFLVLSFTLTACSSNQASQLRDTTTGGSASILDASSDAASIPLVITPGAPDIEPCTDPYAPVLEVLPTGAVLPVFAHAGDGLEIALESNAPNASTQWLAASSIQFPRVAADLHLLARLTKPDCASASEFTQLYSVRDQFAPAAGLTASTAIQRTDPQLRQWATRVLDYTPGDNVATEWTTPERTLGPAGDDPLDVTSLGEGGSITLAFDAVLRDGDGYDFAVFENGFGDDYLELAFVEVSSDGVHFVRFDAVSIVNEPVAAYGTIVPTQIEGFAGKYRVGWGTPFDLAWLRARPEVRAGRVDLSRITSVRVADVVGDGRVRDSLGHVVYDPFPTSGGAGFDLDAIGLINTAP